MSRYDVQTLDMHSDWRPYAFSVLSTKCTSTVSNTCDRCRVFSEYTSRQDVISEPHGSLGQFRQHNSIQGSIYRPGVTA